MFEKFKSGVRKVGGFAVSVARKIGEKTMAVMGAAVLTLGLAAERVMAQPPAMDPVEFPLDPATVGSEIAAGGATIWGIAIPIVIGFALVGALIWKVLGGARRG